LFSWTDCDMCPIDTTSNLWKSTNVKKLFGDLGAVFWPSNNFILKTRNGFSNAVNCSEHCVTAWPSSISDEMIKTIGTKEMDEQHNLNIYIFLVI